MRQTVATGDYFRRKYVLESELPKEYNQSSYFFYSSSSPRVKMSQYAFALGLFTNSSGPKDGEGNYIFDEGNTPISSICVLSHNDYLLMSSEKWYVFLYAYIYMYIY